MTLFEHTVEVTQDNVYAHNRLADALLAENRLDAADRHYAEALRIQPDRWEARLGRSDVQLARGELDAAIAGFRRALLVEPESSRAVGSLGLALQRSGRIDEAKTNLERAIATAPGAAIFHVALGNIASQRGRSAAAMKYFRDALRLQPSLRPAANNLAWLLATAEDAALRDPDAAIEIALRGSLLPGRADPELLDTLAATYASAGRYDEAAGTGERAAAIAEEQGQRALAAQIRTHVALFRSGRPYIERSARPEAAAEGDQLD